MIKPFLVEHLENLIKECDRYIPDRNLASQLSVRNSFLAKFDNLSEDFAGLQKKLINLHHDEFFRQLFSVVSLGELRTSVKKEKTIIGKELTTFLLQFATTYLCEQEFSALTVIKTKARNSLNPGDDLRIVLSKVEPCIEVIMKEKLQFRQSH